MKTQRDPRVCRTWLILAAVAALSGCVTETTLQERRADPEKSLQTHVDLGIGYLSRGDLARAKEKLDRAMELDGNSALVHNAFGLLYQVEGEDAIAERHFQRAIRLDPRFALARNNYGALLFEAGRYPEAIAQLRAAAEDPFYRARPQVYENLGVCYLRLPDLAAAEEAFKRAVAMNPSQARSLLELAELAFGRQDYVNAREFYSRYVVEAQQSARGLWLGIRIARVFQDRNQEASYAMMLKNIFPASDEYRQYQESSR